MPIATTSEFGSMLNAAAAGGWALPAVNVTSSQTLLAVLQGLEDAGADGIAQVTTGGARYLGGGRDGDAARGAAALAEFAHAVAPGFNAFLALHTDHCTPEDADTFIGPLLAATGTRLAAGRPPLFTSHMLDGSALSLDENLRLCEAWLSRCTELGVVLELECGAVGGEEDGLVGDAEGSSRLYTTTEHLVEVARVLGTGERGRYLLAATFGNVHGTAAPDRVELRPAILRDGQRALAEAHPGARFDYVFHGSSGTPQTQLREAIEYGVVKVNIDTTLQHAFTSGVVDHVLEQRAVIRSPDGAQAKKAFDPRAWGRRGQRAMAAAVTDQCRLLGCSGRSLRR